LAEVAHVTRDSDTIYSRSKDQRSTCCRCVK